MALCTGELVCVVCRVLGSGSVRNYCACFSRELPAQVPPLDLDQLRQAGVSHSHGLLKMQAQSASLLCDLGEDGALGLGGESGRQPPCPLPLDNPNPTQIALTKSMKIPGIKHMFDNISSFFLSRLDYYPIFAEAWKQYTFILRGEPSPQFVAFQEIAVVRLCGCTCS